MTDSTSLWFAVTPEHPDGVVGTFVDGVFTPKPSALEEPYAIGPNILWTTAFGYPDDRIDADLTVPPVEVSGSVTAYFDDPDLYREMTECQPLTLREVCDSLGYDVSPDSDIDRILTACPAGPWTLEQLETMFGSDDKTLETCKAKFPHDVSFAPWPKDAGDQ